jgi:hypothetical protein
MDIKDDCDSCGLTRKLTLVIIHGLEHGMCNSCLKKAEKKGEIEAYIAWTDD